MGNQKYDAFLKVAETGSFKQAAHDLGYTQAGISYLVSTLERELDVPLFVRDYGGAHLTSDGADLLPWVQNVCNSERQLARLQQTAPSHSLRVLRLPWQDILMQIHPLPLTHQCSYR